MASSVEHKSVRNTFASYVRGARRAESQCEWLKAAELWLTAAERPCDGNHRIYARARAAFCSSAHRNGWALPKPGETYWYAGERNFLWFTKRPKDAIAVRTIGEPRRVDGKIIVEINKEPYFVNVCRLIPAR